MSDNSTIKKSILSLWKHSTGIKTLKIAGTSMSPLLVQGDKITFIPVDNPETIIIGDIAVFERNAAVIAHRIIGRSYAAGKLYFREKGDNQFSNNYLPVNKLVGKVVTIHKHDGRVIELNNYYHRILQRCIGCYWYVVYTAGDWGTRTKSAVFGNTSAGRLGMFYRNSLKCIAKLPRLFIGGRKNK